MHLCAIRLPRFFEAVARHAVTYLAACLCYSLRVLFFVGEVHLPFAIFFLSCLISLLLPRGKQLLTVQKKPGYNRCVFDTPTVDSLQM